MNRRDMIIKSIGLTTAALILPKLASADEGTTLQIQVLIDRNHGHDFQINLKDYLLLIQKLYIENSTAEGEPAQGKKTAFQIQGTSRHPHLVEMSESELISLITQGTLSKESSEDAGHTHLVQLNLIL